MYLPVFPEAPTTQTFIARTSGSPNGYLGSTLTIRPATSEREAGARPYLPIGARCETVAMAGDPDVQSVIDARLVARSSTAFTAADIAKALHERSFRRSQGDVAAVLD